MPNKIYIFSVIQAPVLNLRQNWCNIQVLKEIGLNTGVLLFKSETKGLSSLLVGVGGGWMRKNNLRKV